MQVGFSDASLVKNLPANAGDSGSIPDGGKGNPHQNSCLENTMDRGAWQATVHGVAKSRTQLSNETTTNDASVLPKFNN